ncbi:flagellar basal body P-ring formation chaperone FlgA [Legionella fairfieldensis]|uniref:flagellar basal body P-ring formation chaperone FlgA n=1 Tax=Legionella fairfieldensis TaxID=45064 RepID=UPI000689038A|nr:flagellar basal body P-ring formation chaperone FlgA [Legionella fairfieldensis]
MLQRITFLFLLIATGFSSQAETIQSLALIKQKIENHLINELSNRHNDDVELQVSAEKIDPRLNLKPCREDKLEVFNPYKTSLLHATIMGIKCQETDAHWTLYVPVKITLQRNVLVAKHLLSKGTQITDNDLEKEKKDLSQLKSGYFTKKSDVIGQLCKHPIGEGSVLTLYDLQTAPLVHKGEQVSIQAINEMINVSMNGIALSDGALGDLIKVQNLSSKKIIEAQVSGNQLVKVSI